MRHGSRRRRGRRADASTGGPGPTRGDSTLAQVVVPSSALWQWKDEIERFWKPAVDDKGRTLRAPKVYTYYDKRHKAAPADLAAADVVLTTYPILEYEYRSVVGRSRVACPHCSKKMLPRKLRDHLKYMCGPYARRTLKQQKTERAAGDAPAAPPPAKRRKRGPPKPRPAKTALAFYKEATRDEAVKELPAEATGKEIAALQTKQSRRRAASPPSVGTTTRAVSDAAKTAPVLLSSRRRRPRRRASSLVESRDRDDDARDDGREDGLRPVESSRL